MQQLSTNTLYSNNSNMQSPQSVQALKTTSTLSTDINAQQQQYNTVIRVQGGHSLMLCLDGCCTTILNKFMVFPAKYSTIPAKSVGIYGCCTIVKILNSGMHSKAKINSYYTALYYTS